MNARGAFTVYKYRLPEVGAGCYILIKSTCWKDVIDKINNDADRSRLTLHHKGVNERHVVEFDDEGKVKSLYHDCPYYYDKNCEFDKLL